MLFRSYAYMSKAVFMTNLFNLIRWSIALNATKQHYKPEPPTGIEKNACVM